MVTDQNRCSLPVGLQTVTASIMCEFPEDFVAHLDALVLPPRRRYQLPKIIDLDGGTVTYDDQIVRKQPDWTDAN
jgi:hypothetical protein